ncbi:MAG TPA: DUF1801 domain-containing protein [Planctomycetes bacterium]|nr:DUF1801 domain-containing protein [Planctomycetota bacterium]
MKSEAKTPQEYIDSLPEDRRATIKKLRALIRKNLPRGYKEQMRWGFICYEVPLSTFPDTYNDEPLMYAAIASQKRHYGVYMCGIYLLPEVFKRLSTEWKKRGTRLDIGKSCLRIASWEKCEPDLIAEAIASVPLEKFVAATNAATSTRKKNKKTSKKTVKKSTKTTAKKTTTKKTARKSKKKTRNR